LRPRIARPYGCTYRHPNMHAGRVPVRTFLRPFSDFWLNRCELPTMSGPSKRIDLVSEVDFRLGDLLVRPSQCTIGLAGADERIEARVMEVLVALHRSEGRTVSRDQLIEACWAGRAVSDDAIARVIAKLRLVARAADPPQFKIETVPRVGFRLEAPPTNGSAPAPAPPADAFERHRSMLSRATIAAAGVALALIAILTAWAMNSGRARDPALGEGSVLVVPFEDLSGHAEMTRLSRRAGEAVARRLTAGSVPTLLSGSPSGTDAASPPAAELLVTGTVDIEGGNTVIKGAISSRENRAVLWTGVTERPTADAVGIDEEFARLVAIALRCGLGERAAARSTLSRDVFPMLLSACEAIGVQDVRALEITRRLIDRTPTLAGAHALRAYALATQASGLDYLSDEAASMTTQMRAAAARALALDPNAVYAHAALGKRIGAEVRHHEREGHLLRALAIDPDHVLARIEYSLLLREVGRVGAARETLTRVDDSVGALINGAFLHAMAGDLRSANKLIDRLAVRKPDWARDARWVVATWWDDPSTALPKLQALAADASRTDDLACFETHLTALVRDAPRFRGLTPECAVAMKGDWKIRMLARQGDIDAAYAAMEEPLPRTRQSHMFLFYPEMKAFRADMRFVALAERLGLVSYWRATGHWPDFCSEPDLPYDCQAWGARKSASRQKAEKQRTRFRD